MIEKYLKAQVCGLIPELTGRVFPGAAPTGVSVPYAVYTCTAIGGDTSLTGEGLFSETIQIDIYTQTYKEAKSYTELLLKALFDYRGDLSGYPVKRVKVLNAMDGYEPEVQEQKTTLELEIYY